MYRRTPGRAERSWPNRQRRVCPLPSRRTQLPQGRARRSSLASNQFPEESAAKSHCLGDTVVWVNLGGSKAYHTTGDKYYGKTKEGAYMCQKEADQSGYHAAGSRAAAKTMPTKSTK